MSSASEILVSVRNLVKHFPITRGGVFRRVVGYVKAVDGVTFDIYKGETLGLVGETGSGKTTVGRTMLRLYEPTEGKILVNGVDLTTLSGRELNQMRRRMSMIFQDPYASLNPRMKVGRIITEPLTVHGIAKGSQKRERAQLLLEQVGLNPNFIDRYPHEFSGGQRQRIGIARALALNPDLVICDEPISSLDVSIQAQVVNLLEGPAERVGIDLPLHRPRPEHGPAHQRQDRRDVYGENSGVGGTGFDLLESSSSVHSSPYVSSPGAGSGAAGEEGAHHS